MYHSGHFNFECVLIPDGWSNVNGLLEPFCNANTAGFQWLTHDGGVSLLHLPERPMVNPLGLYSSVVLGIRRVKPSGVAELASF